MFFTHNFKTHRCCYRLGYFTCGRSIHLVFSIRAVAERKKPAIYGRANLEYPFDSP